MNRIEAEWICAFAIVAKKIWWWRKVIQECPLNVGKDVLMKRCKKCGREFYADCLPCTFRNGGNVVEDREVHRDTLDGFAAMLAHMNLRNQLLSMKPL